MKKVYFFLVILILSFSSCSNLVGDLQSKRNKQGQQQQNQTTTTTTTTTDQGQNQTPAQNPTPSNNNQTLYQVLHYKQNILDDEYTLFETETFICTIGEQSQAKAKAYYGFTSKEFSQTTVSDDSITKINIYYDRNIYTITINLDGGHFTDESQVPLTITGKYESPIDIPNPIKINYLFCGWNKIGGEIPDTIQKSATYTAQWLENIGTPKFIVSYKTDYDTPPANFIAPQGTVISAQMLPELTALGKKFDGWYIGNTKIIGDDYIVQSNVCIEAHWSQGKPIYKVRHWKQSSLNTLENYLAEEEIFEGNKGALTQATPKEYDGYYVDTITQKIINGTNDTVVDIYYFIIAGYIENPSGLGIQLQNDFKINLSSQLQGQSLVVTADPGFTSYVWKIDSRALDEITEIVAPDSPNILTITDFATREEGTYNINVTAIKNGIEYSGLLLQQKD